MIQVNEIVFHTRSDYFYFVVVLVLVVVIVMVPVLQNIMLRIVKNLTIAMFLNDDCHN